MAKIFNPSRRQFMKTSAATGAGLTLAFSLQGCSASEGENMVEDTAFRPNAWLSISDDGTITIMVAEAEMGQGVMTSMPMLVAEELEADWSKIRVQQAPVTPEYGFQSTGGSTSIRQGWEPMRQAGAVAREMLVQAAAKVWGVPATECYAENSAIHHTASGRQSSYDELASVAATLPVPEATFLKEPDEFRIIGKSKPLFHSQARVDGSAQFGIDVQLPGMLIATITHPPVFGGKATKVDSSKAKAIAGVRHVLTIDSGVVVVAEDYWAAKQGRDTLHIEWEIPVDADASSETIRSKFIEAAAKPGVAVHQQGDADSALTAGKTIDAVYELPFQAHATMEPMNCTAHIHDGICEVWAPTQSPTRAQRAAAKAALSKFDAMLEKVRSRITGHSLDNIIIHPTLIGSGFGRRLMQDYVSEVVQIAKAVDAPVKLIWPREEDMQHDFYRPASYHRFSAILNEDGLPKAWHHKIVCPSINEYLWPGSTDGTDTTATEGAEDQPYAIEHQDIRYIMAQTSVPIGFWRSVGHSQNAFVTECFIDELAAAAKQDPLTYRLTLLKDKPRHREVLILAAEKAGWGKALPKGHYLGIAVHYCFGSYVAQAAEISIEFGQEIRVHRVVCAVDCGTVVNPDTVAAQMEGGITFALSATLKGAITLNNGQVEQSNYHDFPVIRLEEMPIVETYIVPSQASPGGIGEPPVPPLAPAVANAVFAATGQRLRQLPLRLEMA